MALLDMEQLAQEFGKGIRQTRRWIAKLRTRELIKVIFRPGRTSIIDVSPLVLAVKRLVGWQDAEQPTAETLAEVISEPDLSWLEPEESEEEAPIPDTGAFWDWNTIKDRLASDPNISRVAFTNHLATTEGVDCIGHMLIVECDPGIKNRIEASYKDVANLLVLDLLDYDGVVFRERKPKKKPKKLGPLARLAVAGLGG